MIRTLTVTIIVLLGCLVCIAEGTEHLRTDAMYWHVIKSEHFTIVHPQGLLSKAREAAFYLEEGYSRISKDLDTQVKRTILVVLYRSQNTFEQNNIYGGSVPESLAAFAETYRDRIVLPVYPSAYQFKYILQHELTHIFEYAALFPRRIPSFYIIRFPFYPQWFMEGLSEYESDYNYAYRSMILRDKALDKKLEPMYKLFGFSHLNPHETVPAYKESGEFVRYLVSINPEAPRILLKTFADHMPWKTSSIIKKAFSSDYKELDLQFRKNLRKQARKETESRTEPSLENRIAVSKDTYYSVYDTDAVWSPDGAEIAFLSDMRNKTAVYITDKKGTEIRSVVPLRLNFTIESIHRGKGRSTAWGPKENTLYFVGEWANRDYIYRYDLALKKLKRIDVKCEEVRDISTAGENKIIFSGVRSGISDIYLYDLASETEKQVTHDAYDDSAPVWNDERKAVVYSSERKGQRDLIVMDMKADDPGKTAVNITNSPANEISPCWNKKGDKILFVSDAQSFYDMYLIEVPTGKIYKQTAFKGGAFQPVFSPDETEILFSYYRHGRYSLYAIPVNPDKREETALEPADKMKENLSRFKEGQSGPETAEKYLADFAWEGLLPLVVFNWGQAGDTFGNHRISGSFYPGFTEDETYLGGSLVYWNSSSRFDFGAGIQKDFWEDIETDERTEDFRIFLQARYPFDAYRSITAGVISGDRQEYIDSVKTEDKSRFGWFALAAHDNRLFRGLSFVRGQRLAVGVEIFPGESGDSGTERYKYVFGSFEQAFTFRQDHTLYLYLSGGMTGGRDKPELDLADAVRGYNSNEYEGYNQLGGTLEYRFPLHRDGNYSILGHYLLLKDIRGFAFADIGVVSAQNADDFIDDALGFDLDARKSIGAGIRMDFYGMQKAPFALKVGFA
ncbi:hypothetical protein ACFL6F_03905, partial [Planctomycetota bacterium]